MVRLRGRDGQGGCELRSEAFVKIQKKKNVYFGGGEVGLGGRGQVRGGGQGGCEWRSKAFVKIQKKIFFWGGGGRVSGGGVGLGGGWVGGGGQG